MRRNMQAVFVISALIILVLCCACTTPLSGEKTSQEGGLTQVSVPVESPRISFEEAQQKLEGYRTDSINGTAGLNSLYYIVAKDVDESGNATSWVFGINQGGAANLLVYDKTGWTIFPWSSQIREKIALDRIVRPDALFARNKATIVTNPSQTIPERRDLEMQDGIYTLTIYSGTSNRVLTFNATSGALIT
jgi:hypothetical protein